MELTSIKKAQNTAEATMCHFDSQTKAQEAWVLVLQRILALMYLFKIKQRA